MVNFDAHICGMHWTYSTQEETDVIFRNFLQLQEMVGWWVMVEIVGGEGNHMVTHFPPVQQQHCHLVVHVLQENSL